MDQIDSGNTFGSMFIPLSVCFVFFNPQNSTAKSDAQAQLTALFPSEPRSAISAVRSVLISSSSPYSLMYASLQLKNVITDVFGLFSVAEKLDLSK
jgi:hypothetical protein